MPIESPWEQIRQVLLDALIYHQRLDVGHCACGWGVLGASHAEHIIDVIEDSLVARYG